VPASRSTFEMPAGDSPVADWDDMVLVGIVARTHGNRGEVILNSLTDFPDLRFRVGAQLFARKGSGPVEVLDVTAVRFQQGRPILGVAGIGSISEAERLAGYELKVPASEQGPLPEGQYYHHQLIGCEVVTESGERLGKVTEVQGDGAATRLVIRGARAEVLVPLAQEMCRIDVDARRIVVTPPDGLLEVNGEWRD
jgi:16S rRNA processing protein RimM